MDQGPPDSKRPRLSTGPAPWSVGGPHHGAVSILHPTPPPPPGHSPHHLPTSTQYQQQHSPLSYGRTSGPGDPPLPPPPPPPPAVQTPIDDRRQHEHDRFPPMQEHRQQPPHSPAHPSYPPYPPREPMIKPDPSDDTLPHLRRPHSTGASAQDSMTPVTPHSAVPPPPHSQPYGEDRRHMSFDNGPQPPSMYSRQPSYPPQTPLSHSQSYEYQQPPQYGSHNDLPYQIQVAASSGKRKAQRASQACDSCRQLKAKCDELKPCKNCKEKGTECKYREAVPKQQDKIATDILDAILGVATKLDSNEDRMDKRMRRFENALRRIDPRALAFLDEDHRPESAGSAGPTSGDSSSLSPEGAATTALPIIDSLEARAITRNMEEETDAEPPGPVVPPGEPSIPVNHTTLAARLLEWDPIAVLIQDILETEDVNVGQFPIREEERRGLLRIWGRGEGLDSSHSGRNDTEAMRDAGVMEPPDDISDAGAPSPADCWGGISGSPAPIDGKSVIAVQTPDFSENVVYKYIQSFQDNIQNLHPLILPQELNAMVKLFLDTVQQSTARQSKSASIAKFVGSGASQSETGAKRKRRTEDEGGPESPPVSPRSAKPVFQRSINNALVLLALALGKICLHKDRLPDVVPVSEPLHGSPVARNGYPASPIQGSSPSYTSHSHSNSLPSPKDGAERPGASRRSSFQSGGPSMKGATSLRRNMDVIPGLDYFAYATDILGGQLAGTSLRHIHAYLLAGLYHGQLGRVLESYAYIKEAGYAVQIKMRPSLDRLSKITGLQVVTREADNRLLFAFWTCLQLESDIIAELPLPQSGVLAFEEMMPNPNMELAGKHGFDKRVLSSYLAQLYTRKSLNKIHKQLFDPNQKVRDEAVAPGGSIIEAIRSLLDLKTFVAPEFRFDPSDPPANDILSARLRAKYWGARVITHRHFVREILDHNFRRLMTNEPAGVGIPHITIEYAGEGVQALIESTRAFHELKEKRFIITNVFGTSHAQWGNLLVLSAVFRDPTLSQFIDEQLLRELFRRTIGFFRVIAHRTSALYKDMRILEGLERKLFRRQTNVDVADHPTGSSFSSHHSGGPPPPVPQMGPIPSVHAMPPPVSAPHHALNSPGNHNLNHNHSHHIHNVMMRSPPMPSPQPVPGAMPMQDGYHGMLPGMMPHMQQPPPPPPY